MAIMICKNCGKKVSDTVEVCIHCGKDPRTEPAMVVAEPIKKEEPEKVQQEIELEDESPVDFFQLDEEEQLKLESEFLKEDKSS